MRPDRGGTARLPAMAVQRLSVWFLLLVAMLAGCSVQGDVAGDEVVGADDPAAEPAPEPDEELDATEVLAAVGPSVALVSTPAGTGSAVAYDDRFLVTNAHVVDPFSTVDVTFEGGDPLTDVPVLGVDLVADLAVLGPLRNDLPVASLGPADDLVRGAPVFLVGYPGDQRQAEATVVSGVISRRRAAERWGLELLQSDTTIGPGQSGGALVDDRGTVVGISGMGDDDGFAYSLVGEEVIARAEAIVAGEDATEEAWVPVPDEEGATTNEVVLFDGLPAALYVPHVDADRQLTVEVPPGAALAITDPGASQYPWATNGPGAELGDDGYWWSEDAERIDDDPPGSWSVDLYAGFDAVLLVLPGTSDRFRFEVRTDVPVVEVELPYVEVDLAVGDEDAGVVSHLEDGDFYLVELEAGEPVEVAARSALGDMAWDLFLVDDPEGRSESYYADDGGGGVFDLDAVDTVTPEISGSYLLNVYAIDGYATAYEVSVAPG